MDKVLEEMLVENSSDVRMRSEAGFCAKNLGKMVGPAQLLSNVSLHVRPGEAVAVLGPSGAGKTLLLKALSFVDPPSSGQILWQGQTWNFGGRRNQPPPWPRIVLMFQSGGILGHLSLLRNITFQHDGKPSAHAKQVATRRLASQLYIEEVLSRPAAYCSVGQKQRAAFIRAIVSEADLVLLDEPTASLDPLQVMNVSKILLGEKVRGRSFIISTHMLGLARRVCERFIYIQDGVVVANGSTSELEDTSNPDLKEFIALSTLG